MRNIKAGIKRKESIGIACCRWRDGRPEILLVNKRFTYAYNTFIHGGYRASSDAELITLFDGMTVEEKLDILSLNFQQIWYRVWLNHNKVSRSNYYLCESKYKTSFLGDGGARLRRLIEKSKSVTRLWEIPKGRRLNTTEENLNCAVREFQEETSIDKSQYKLLPRYKKIVKYIDDGVQYECIYYLAISTAHDPPRDARRMAGWEQRGEILEVRWMNSDQVRLVDADGRLGRVALPIMKYLSKNKSKF